MNSDNLKRGWVYAELGDYHRNLDLNWSYAPTYLVKRKAVRSFMGNADKVELTLDVGCGEGVVVEEFRSKGYHIKGIDANYSSVDVVQGNVLSMPFKDCEVGTILFLDVLEHIPFSDQPAALQELIRVLKPGGMAMITVPNLAHLNSRVRLLLSGDLDRTDAETNHVGERPYRENFRLIRGAGFEIEKVSGITFTLPFLYRSLICQQARRLRWLHDALEPLASLLPTLAMLTVFICKKPRH